MGLGSQDASIDIGCSICLGIVADGGDRSTARLQCGHQFHLDCIGSAFNAKGVMQCPNCRKVEKGNWLFANGSCSLPEVSFDERTHDEDLYGLSYTEMISDQDLSKVPETTAFNIHHNCRKVEKGNWLFANGSCSLREFIYDECAHDEDLYDLCYAEMMLGVRWCLFNRLAQLPPSFEDGEATPAFPFQETTLAVDPGSYLIYRQPLQTSASSDARSSENPIDHRSHASGPLEVQTHGWEHHPPPYSLPSSRPNDSYQDAFSSTIVPPARVNSNGPARSRSFAHPFIRGHGYGSRPAGSFVSSPIPQHYNPRHHDHRYRHQPGAMNGLPQVGQVPPVLHDPTTYYLFPPTAAAAASSSRSHQEVESMRGHFYPWRPFPRSHNGSDGPSSQPHVDGSRPYI